MPTIVRTNPGYVKDVIALATSRGSITGDLGALNTFWKFQAVCDLAGGLIRVFVGALPSAALAMNHGHCA